MRIEVEDDALDYVPLVSLMRFCAENGLSIRGNPEGTKMLIYRSGTMPSYVDDSEMIRTNYCEGCGNPVPLTHKYCKTCHPKFVT